MKTSKITLNFLNDYYLFYDWLNTDKIKKYNNICVYRVSQPVFNDLCLYKIKNNLFINKIIIFTDTYSYIAIKFNSNGYSDFKSSLLLEDEMKLNNKVDSLKKLVFNYDKVKIENLKKDIRINNQIREVITKEIEKLKDSNIEKLEYLYYEWFKKKECDKDKMINSINKKLLGPIGENEKKIFNIIRCSYKIV